MKPSPVSPLQYINDRLGIDASKSTKYSRSSGVLKNGVSAYYREENIAADYLEKIYDVVVGFNHEQGQRFRNDTRLSTPQRFGATELKHVIEHSQAIISRPDTSEWDKKIFKKIVQASQMYKDFLEGRFINVPKNSLTNMGNRHTLIRGKNGRVFEMLNSMTEKELARCSEKTGSLVSAVENPKDVGKKLHTHKAFKVELGSGNFGKTRIAREIGGEVRGGYVAVKKTHPRLVPSMEQGLVARPSSRSNFYNLTQEQKNKLRSINQAVISPIDHVELHSHQSMKLNNEANSFNQIVINSGDQAEIQELISMITGHLAKHFSDADEASEFLIKKLSNGFNSPVFNEKSQYTFSELGVTTVQHLIEKLNVIRYAFEGSAYLGELTPTAESLQTAYSNKYYSPSQHNPSKQAIVDKINEKDFNLKDVVNNQRFINTLAKKILEALQALHSKGIAHHDIKPDNIVITSEVNSRGNVLGISAKLIDIDLLQPVVIVKSLANIAGCIPFMPPEASIPEFDGSIAYQGQRGDAYAMGLTLRHVAGYSLGEMFELSKDRKSEILYRRLDELDGDRLENRKLKKEFLAGLAKTHKDMNLEFSESEFLRAIKLMKVQLGQALESNPSTLIDNQVQRRIFLNAKEKTDLRRLKEYEDEKKKGNAKTSHFLTTNSVKDVSDRLLKDWHKRDTIGEALDRDLFKHPDNLLNDNAFANHTTRILRYGNVMEMASISIDKLNGKTENSEDSELPALRSITRLNLARSRGEPMNEDDATGLSENERARVGVSEIGQQFNASGRRVVRNAGNAMRNSMAGLGLVSKQSKFDFKNQYKK